MGSTVRIPLTRGKYAIVDAEDYARIRNAGTWYAEGSGKLYSARAHKESDGTRTYLRMHRVILNAPDDRDVDHVNGNGLDNRKENLRIATRSQNNANRSKPRHGLSSRFKGVSWRSKSNRWYASIAHLGKSFHLGEFDNEIDAAHRYDKAAKKLHGRFAKTNF